MVYKIQMLDYQTGTKLINEIWNHISDEDIRNGQPAKKKTKYHKPPHTSDNDTEDFASNLEEVSENEANNEEFRFPIKENRNRSITDQKQS